MIVRWQDGRALACRRTLMALYGVHERTVRRHCADVIVCVDEATSTILYDALAAAQRLDKVIPRATRAQVRARLHERLNTGQPGRERDEEGHQPCAS